MKIIVIFEALPIDQKFLDTSVEIENIVAY